MGELFNILAVRCIYYLTMLHVVYTSQAYNYLCSAIFTPFKKCSVYPHHAARWQHDDSTTYTDDVARGCIYTSCTLCAHAQYTLCCQRVAIVLPSCCIGKTKKVSDFNGIHNSCCKCCNTLYINAHKKLYLYIVSFTLPFIGG